MTNKKKKFRITQIRHPLYSLPDDDFDKWRICYRAGDTFIRHYLQRFNPREGDENFVLRQKIAYAPAFAKAAINEIRNSVYQRMGEIRRLGGPKNYQDAIQGNNAGVDLCGSSMNAFIGQDVLTELMIMGKVGIFVDKQRIDSPLLADNKDKRPYLYYYTRENILSWDSTYVQGDEVYTNLLLRNSVMEYDPDTSLPLGYREVYRHFWININDGYVYVDDWIDVPDENNKDQYISIKTRDTIKLDLKEIPFVYLDIGQSMMEDIANYQIGLLNLASSDLNYAFRSNFVFYTEQYDAMAEQTYGRRAVAPKVDPNNPLVDIKKLDAAQQGTAALAGTASSTDQVNVGGVSGRKYGKGLDRPGFIAPPSEPLMASMKKEEQMKEELRLIINLSMSNVAPQHASAESKKEDKSGLENGLSGIGLELEYGERRIAKLWSMYENSKEVAEVNYPRKYEIKSDADRQTEAKNLNGLKGAAPSRIYAKEIGKEIARIMLSGKVRQETLTQIEDEIDKAEYITSDAKEIQIDVEAGLVDKETASNARGYNGKIVVPIAAEEYTKRMAQIAASQQKGVGAARGVGGNPGDANIEKQASQHPDTNPTSGGSLTRGGAN